MDSKRIVMIHVPGVMVTGLPTVDVLIWPFDLMTFCLQKAEAQFSNVIIVEVIFKRFD